MLGDSSRARRCRIPQRIVLVLAAASAHLGWAADSVPQELPPQEEQAALRSAEATGLTIYKHDHAAAVATDAVGALGILKSDKRLRGWITESQGEGILVTFISGDTNEVPQALYRVSVSKEGEVTGPPQEFKVPQALTEFESRAAAARLFAAKYSFQPCAERYNTVVLPADSSPSPNWMAYLIPGTQDALRIPLGGAHRLELDATAEHLVNERGFTRSCVVLGDPKGDPKGEPKKRPVGLFATHLMDPVPTEIHVFWNLWAGIPLYISTPPNGTVWNLSNGHISLVKRGGAK
jgi:hypothetical protein